MPDGGACESLKWEVGQTPLSLKHADGWCAIAPGVEYDMDGWSFPTLCEQFINCPTGSRFDEPDCPDCLERLMALVPMARPGTRLRPSDLADRALVPAL